MRYLFGMDREVIDHINEAWYYIDMEYNLDLWPLIKPVVELCTLTTIHELITLHYMLGYDVEEYIHNCNWHHVEDYVHATIGSDDEVLDDLLELLESNAYMGNKLATSICRKSRYMRTADDIASEPDDRVRDDLQRSLSNALIDAVIDSLRSVEILDYLPKVDNELSPRYRMPIQDVDVNIQKLKLTIYH